MSGNLFSDDAVRKLRQMFHEWSREDKRLPRYNHPSARPMLPREDLVLYQASSTGTLPAVTASTTGVTPGKITTAKQLSINSSDDAAAVNSGRDLTIYNLGGGSGAASHVGWAHREYKTGRWVTSVPQAAAASTPNVCQIYWDSVNAGGSSTGGDALVLQGSRTYPTPADPVISSTNGTGDVTLVFARAFEGYCSWCCKLGAILSFSSTKSFESAAFTLSFRGTYDSSGITFGTAQHMVEPAGSWESAVCGGFWIAATSGETLRGVIEGAATVNSTNISLSTNIVAAWMTLHETSDRGTI